MNDLTNFDDVYALAKIREIREKDPKDNLFPDLITPVEDLAIIGEEISLKELIMLRQFKIIQELDNKICNGRIKDRENEKIKLEYYKVYINAVNTFIKLTKGHATTYDKDVVKELIKR